MNAPKYTAMKREFPWLHNYLEAREIRWLDIEGIRVERVDDELFHQKAYPGRAFVFFNKDGAKIGAAGNVEPRRFNWVMRTIMPFVDPFLFLCSFKSLHVVGEYFEYLAKIEVEVWFIVKVEYWGDTDLWYITIYKP